MRGRSAAPEWVNLAAGLRRQRGYTSAQVMGCTLGRSSADRDGEFDDEAGRPMREPPGSAPPRDHLASRGPAMA